MLAQITFDIKTILKDKIYYAVIAMLAVLFILLLLTPYRSGGGAFGLGIYQENYEIAKYNAANYSANENMPESYKESSFARLELYQTIVESHTKIDSREQIEAMLKLEELRLQED